DRSYGIHVARLAGLPPAAVARAEQVLEGLEKDEISGATTRMADDLPLFSAMVEGGRSSVAAPARPSEAEEALRAVNPDELTPREALDMLYRLRGLLHD
ncbi:MAG: DNA mismatch repair protein MutS, partial [Rhodospirillales bacterium]|nr:DNA mismatch repair protein MutS [Rhodospirillales bacterium]